ncbi:hypothetical protein J6590_017630 [Homalodisca vitripennis]|nr:hypothetical protein J6590_017630 [Homalodisca vitripennis]
MEQAKPTMGPIAHKMLIYAMHPHNRSGQSAFVGLIDFVRAVFGGLAPHQNSPVTFEAMLPHSCLFPDVETYK